MPNLGEIFGHPTDMRQFEADSRYILPQLAVGIEYECEDLPIMKEVLNDIAPFWDLVTDNSLRGPYRFELRTKWPVYGVDLANSVSQLTSLIGYYEKKGKKPFKSQRVGTHLHFDMRGFSLDTLLKILAVYGSVEPALLKYIERNYYDRSKNIYCLPVSTCDDLSLGLPLLDTIKRAIREGSLRRMMDDGFDLKYSSINLTALKKQGSIEFRTLPAEHDSERLNRWINLIMSTIKYAIENKVDLDNIPNHASELGIENFLNNIFGPDLIEHIQYPGIEYDVLEGIRNIQILSNNDDLIQATQAIKVFAMEEGIACSPFKNPLISRINKHYKAPARDTAKQAAKRKKPAQKQKAVPDGGKFVVGVERIRQVGQMRDLPLFVPDEQEDF